MKKKRNQMTKRTEMMKRINKMIRKCWSKKVLKIREIGICQTKKMGMITKMRSKMTSLIPEEIKIKTYLKMTR